MKSLREIRQWTDAELSKTTNALFSLVAQLDALIAAAPPYLTPDFYEAARFLERLELTLRSYQDAQPRLKPGELVHINEHLLSIRWPINEFLEDEYVVEKRRMFGKVKADDGKPRYRGNGGIWTRVVELACGLGDEILMSESEIDVALRDWKRRTTQVESQVVNSVPFNTDRVHRLWTAFLLFRLRTQKFHWPLPKSSFIIYRRPTFVVRGCFIIATIMSAFIGLSLFFSLFFVTHKEYGYNMSDSFTLGGYVIAVGAFICSFLFGCHFPHCRCWDSERRESNVTEEETHELQGNFFRSQSMGIVDRDWEDGSNGGSRRGSEGHGHEHIV